MVFQGLCGRAVANAPADEVNELSVEMKKTIPREK